MTTTTEFNPDTWRREITYGRRSPDMDVEDRMVATLVADLLAHDPDWQIAVCDGEEICCERTRDPQEIMKALFSTDEDMLFLYRPASRWNAGEVTRFGWVKLIGGNGVDIVSDYTTNIPDSVMARVNAIHAEYA